MKDAKIAIRIEQEQKQRIKQLIHDCKFETTSQAVRAALREFLKTA